MRSEPAAESSLHLPTLRRVFDALADGVVVADAGGTIVYVNPAAGRLHGTADLGVPVGEWSTRYHLFTLAGEPFPPDRLPLARAALTGETVESAYWLIRRPDGAEIVAEGTASPLTGADGRPAGAVLVLRDVTAREALRRDLARSEARFRGLSTASPAGVFQADLEGHVSYVNPRLASIWDRPEPELLGRGWLAGVHADDAPALVAGLRAANAAGREFEHVYRVVRRDGSERLLHGRSAVVRDAAGRPAGVVGTVDDITEERRALAAEQRALERTALLQRLTAAFSAVRTPAEVVAVALERGVAAVGAATGLAAGLAADGRRLTLLGARGYGPGFAERYAEIPLDAPLAVAAVALTGRAVWLADADEAVRAYPGLAPVLHEAGVQASASLPLKAADGRTVGVLAFNFRDPRPFDAGDRGLLTAVAQQCAQALERARLYEAERAARAAAEAANAAKSRFLATTSHEIRTPINAVLGYTDLLELGLAGPLTEQQRDYLARVRVAGRNLLAVVNQVLDLSKIEADRVELRREAALASEAAERAVAQVAPQAVARGLAMTDACGAAADAAFVGDAARVEQLLVNLLSNAVKFTPPGGRVTLSCAPARALPPDAALDPAAAPDGWMYFRVEDTGIGIPAERRVAVWEPFEQADAGHTRAYGGTGLGLTISRRLARLMGGDITLRSEEGAGATFLVWLPAAPPDARPPARAPGERRTRARLARGLSKAATATLLEVEGVLAAYAERLRTDPATPSARRVPASDVEDHTVTFLADMAACLGAIENARGAPSEALRDGSAIQRVIAERHGAQRARMGWTESEVRREFAILREELERAVRRRVGGEADVELDAALALLAGFIAHAERTSVRVFHAPPAPER
jgi:PAS domain S-box-containing protein